MDHHAYERRGEPADPHAVEELILYLDNDGDLYRQMTVPIQRNLARKMVKGTYDPERGPDAWRYLADAAAKKYTREFPGEFGSSRLHGSYGIFSPATRDEVAEDLARRFEMQTDSGELDPRELAARASEASEGGGGTIRDRIRDRIADEISSISQAFSDFETAPTAERRRMALGYAVASLDKARDLADEHGLLGVRWGDGTLGDVIDSAERRLSRLSDEAQGGGGRASETLTEKGPRRTFYVFKRHEAGPFATLAEAQAERENVLHEIARRNDIPIAEAIDAYGDILEIVPIEREIWVTNASADYDYVGYNFQIGEEGPLRVMALDPTRKWFQIGRYQSGMKFAAPYGSEEHKYFLEVRG